MPSNSTLRPVGRTPSTPGPASADPRTRILVLCALSLAAAVAVAYHNTLSVPFVFDDETGIVANRSLTSLWSAWNPPATAGTGGRPLLNASFALNQAIGGIDVLGYHLANIAIHLGAALLLFGVVRRTLLRAAPGSWLREDSLPLAFATAALWAVHPLTTASVTYISQRAESLMALLYLAALYGFVRSTESSRPARWLGLSAASCLLGVATKEVMATAPLLILAYDRFFIAGGWRDALKRRAAYYTSLAASWVLLAFLMRSVATREVGFERGVSAWTNLWVECGAVARYLRLSIWPFPQVFDYGPDFNPPLIPTLLSAAAIAAVVIATAWLWRRGSRSAFLGIAFVAILLPTSSVVPIALQPIAENRAYLPLAAVLTAAVLALRHWLGRRSYILISGVGVALIVLTIARNADYHTAINLWTDTARKAPLNFRAERNLGYELARVGRHEVALVHYARSLKLLERGTGLSPQVDRRMRAETQNAVANELIALRHRDEAMQQLEQSLASWPTLHEAHLNRTKLLIDANRAGEALTHAQAYVAAQPKSPEAHYACGLALAALYRLDEAAAEYDAALRLDPDYVRVRMDRAAIDFSRGKFAEAIPHYEAVLRLQPGDPVASQMLSQCLLGAGKTDEAIAFLQRGVKQRTDRGVAFGDLGIALFQLGRMDEAQANLEKALKLQPELTMVRFHHAMALGRLEHWTAAAAEFETLLQQMPENAVARLNYAVALAQSGRPTQAISELETVVRQQPDNREARELLRTLRTGR